MSVNFVLNDMDLQSSFRAETCTKEGDCDWIEDRNRDIDEPLRPALFLPFKNPLDVLVPKASCSYPGCNAGSWKCDKSYTSHYKKAHGVKAPERVIFFGCKIYYFIYNFPILELYC